MGLWHLRSSPRGREGGAIRNKRLASSKSRVRKRVGEILIDLGYISEEDFVTVFSEQQSLPWVELDPYYIDPTLKDIIPREVAGKYSILPLLLLKNSLLGATPDLLGEEKLKELEGIAQHRIELRLVTLSDFNFAFHRYYDWEQEMKGPRLGKILAEEKLITKEELQKAFKYQKKSGKRLGEALVELKLLKEEELEEALSRQLSLNCIDPDPQLIDTGVLVEIPEEVARRTCSLPLLLIGNTLLVATHRPDEALREELTRISGRNLKCVLASREKIMSAIDHCYTQWRQEREESEKLGGYLVKHGLISPSHLEEGLAIQEKSREKLGKILVEKGFISSEQLMEALSARLGIAYVKIDLERIDRGLTKDFYSQNYLIKNCVVPLYIEGDKLLIAMEDPLDLKAMDEVRWSSMKSVLPVMAARDDIYGAINYIFESL